MKQWINFLNSGEYSAEANCSECAAKAALIISLEAERDQLQAQVSNLLVMDSSKTLADLRAERDRLKERCELLKSVAGNNLRNAVDAVIERDHLKAEAAIARVEGLKDEIDAVLIGGNHLASAMMGECPPTNFKKYQIALKAQGQPYADMWAAWNAIMKLSQRIAELEATREQQK